MRCRREMSLLLFARLLKLPSGSRHCIDVPAQTLYGARTKENIHGCQASPGKMSALTDKDKKPPGVGLADLLRPYLPLVAFTIALKCFRLRV
jgi:hypothetical protein